MSLVLVVGAFKGGVSKTITTANIAGALTRQKKKVMVWDLDFQGNSTLGAGYEPDTVEGNSIYEAIHGRKDVREIVLQTKAGYYLVPSSDDLAAFDHDAYTGQIRNMKHDEIPFIIQNLISQFSDDEVDCHIIDTSPSLSMLSVNAMVSADIFLVPTQMRRFGVRGTVKYIEHLRNIRNSWIPEKSFNLMSFATFYSKAKGISDTSLQELRKQAILKGFDVAETVIPETIQYENSIAYANLPSTLHLRPTEPAAKAYFDLVKEVFK